MMSKVAALGSLLAVLTLVSSCSQSNSSGSSSPAAGRSAAPTSSSSSAPPSITPKPTTFRSKAYGYTVTVPAEWSSRQAYAKWDGHSELDGTSALVDLFGQPSETKGVFVAAAPWKRELAAYTAFFIAWNAHFHGDYCPAEPHTRSRVTVGGQRGVMLAYNCGILVNNVVTVHKGIGYCFVFVDRNVAAATDPADHLTFVKLLRSVKFSR